MTREQPMCPALASITVLTGTFGRVSRASHEATIFTDDVTKLSPQLSVEVSKTSAVEFDEVHGKDFETESILSALAIRLVTFARRQHGIAAGLTEHPSLAPNGLR